MAKGLVRAVGLCAVTMTVGACGGAGTSAAPVAQVPAPTPAPTPTPTPTPAPAPTPPPTTPGFDTQEYQNSRGAAHANAIRAYEAGATGKNITVAVIDTSFVPTDAVQFAGRIHPASTDVVAGRGLYGGAGQVADGHGAEVSSVVGAARDNIGMQGVAFDSTLLMVRTDLPNTCNPRCAVSLSDLPKAMDLAIKNGARVINLSMTFFSLPDGFAQAVDRATAAGIVVVIAAGNQGQAEAVQSSLLALQPEARGMMIVAGATETNGTTLASFSNRAGNSASAYLTAVGSNVQVTDQDGNVVIRGGTSLSTPVISGAAALLAQAFPNLTGQQIVNLLLTTASDLGAPGTDALYGRGALNLTAAFAPQGTMSLAGSAATVALLSDGMLSPAMGDASTRLSGAVFLDGYARAYRADLTQTLSRAATSTPLHATLGGRFVANPASFGPLAVSVVTRRDMGAPVVSDLRQLGLSGRDARVARAVSASGLARLSSTTTVEFGIAEGGGALRPRFADQAGGAFIAARDPLAGAGLDGRGATSVGIRHDFGALSLALFSERGAAIDRYPARSRDRSGYHVTSFIADRALGRMRFGIGGSLLDEEATALGGHLPSALSGAGSRSWFADGSASLDFGGGWRSRASYRRGWTEVRGNNALVTGGRLSSNAFSLDLVKLGTFAPMDLLAFRFMQPLRVRNGGLDVRLPVSYDYASGEVGYQRSLLDLAPAGRELAYEFSYSASLWGGSMAANAFLRTDPGNIASARSDVGGAIRFSLGF